MPTTYNGEHAVIFGDGDFTDGIFKMTRSVNTWNNWFLIPTSRPTLSTPGPQTKFVDIPGMNGGYDISDYLTPNMVFTDRSGSLEFVVDNEHADWLTIYLEIATYLHGQKMKMILADDPEWYYEGRFNLDEWKSEQKNSKIAISYRVYPFKKSIYSAFAENLYWDTFCFERDMDWSQFWHVTVSSTPKVLEVTSYGTPNELQIRLVSGTSVTAAFGGTSITVTRTGRITTLGSGDRSGVTELTLSGSGIVDVGWQKLSL